MSKNQPPREHSASETSQWHRARGFRLPQRGHRPLLLTWMFQLHQTGKQNKSAQCNQRKRWFCPPQSNSPTVWVWSNQSILKEISPGISLEGMMLKLKLQYFGHLLWRVDSLEKTDAGRDWGQEEKGTTEDEMAGWHHQLDGHEFEWTPGVGDGQGGLACCDSWGCKESDTTD